MKILIFFCALVLLSTAASSSTSSLNLSSQSNKTLQSGEDVAVNQNPQSKKYNQRERSSYQRTSKTSQSNIVDDDELDNLNHRENSNRYLIPTQQNSNPYPLFNLKRYDAAKINENDIGLNDLSETYIEDPNLNQQLRQSSVDNTFQDSGFENALIYPVKTNKNPDVLDEIQAYESTKNIENSPIYPFRSGSVDVNQNPHSKKYNQRSSYQRFSKTSQSNTVDGNELDNLNYRENWNSYSIPTRQNNYPYPPINLNRYDAIDLNDLPKIYTGNPISNKKLRQISIDNGCSDYGSDNVYNYPVKINKNADNIDKVQTYQSTKNIESAIYPHLLRVVPIVHSIEDLLQQKKFARTNDLDNVVVCQATSTVQ